jgi:hypothetical protein
LPSIGDSNFYGIFKLGVIEMSKLFDVISSTVSGVIDNCKIATEELYAKHGERISFRALDIIQERAKEFGVQLVANDDEYKLRIVDPLWDMATPLHIIGRERLGWDTWMFKLRDSIFVIEGDTVKVCPNAREKVMAALRNIIGHHNGTSSDGSAMGESQSTEPGD